MQAGIRALNYTRKLTLTYMKEPLETFFCLETKCPETFFDTKLKVIFSCLMFGMHRLVSCELLPADSNPLAIAEARSGRDSPRLIQVSHYVPLFPVPASNAYTRSAIKDR